jgi:HK97 family phage portal protein
MPVTYPNFPAGAQQMQLVRTADPGEYRRDGRTVRVQGFNSHPVVHACIRTVADIVATIPLVVLQEKGDMESRVPESHPLQQLLDYPGARFTARQFRSRFAVDFLGYGNAFFQLERNGTQGRIRGMRPVNPESVQQVWIDTEGDPRRYDYANWAGIVVDVPVENMLHFKDLEMGRPFEADVFGYPRGATAIGSMLSDNEATQYVRQVVTNDGTPTFAVLMSDEASAEDALAMQERYVARTVDRGKRGTPAFFGAVKDIRPIGFTLSDLEFPDLRRISREDICAAYGVDPRMVGIASASNDSGLSGAQYKEARARLIQHTIEPMLGAFEDELNHWLAPEYGNVWISYDHDVLRNLVEDDNETSTRIREELKTGLRTWEESRRALRLSPVPEPTDTVVQTVGVSFVPASAVVIDPSAIPAEAPATDDEPTSDAPTQAEDMEDESEDDIDEPDEGEDESADESRAEGVTNFPSEGDNKKVSLKNSQWKLFPVNEAQDLKDNWPEIWAKGGNIRGNSQFAKLAPIAKRGGVAKTKSEIGAVKLREAWVARHKGDFQLAGVVAQIKWLAVGDRGIDHMRKVIREAKAKIKDRSDAGMEQKRAYWERAVRELDRQEQSYQLVAESQFAREKRQIEYILKSSQTTAEAIARIRAYFDETGDTRVLWEESLTPLIRESFASGAKQVAGVSALLAMVLLPSAQWQSEISATDLKVTRDYVLSVIRNRAVTLAGYVGQTTADEIMAAIRAGEMGALSMDEIARLVGKAVYGEEKLDWRTKLIARTESAGAYAQGSWEQAMDLGIFTTKEWLAFEDNRTRESHSMAMFQGPIPMDQRFANGLLYPFQPGAPADEVINCRCVLAFSDEPLPTP